MLKPILPFLDTNNLPNQDQDSNQLDQLSLQEQIGSEEHNQAINQANKSPRFLASSLAKRKLLLKTERKYCVIVILSIILNIVSFCSQQMSPLA